MSIPTADIVLHDLANEIQPLVIEAELVIIRDQGTYDQAASFIKNLAANIARVQESIAPHKQNARKTWKDLCDHESRIVGPAIEAKTILAKKIIAWDEEQQKLRDAERRRLEEDARRADEDATLKAAERAKAEGCSEELIDAILEEVSPPPAIVAPQTYRPAVGISAPRENWKAEITSVVDLVRFIVTGDRKGKPLAHPELLPLLISSPVQLSALARAQKQHCTVPGVRVWNDPSIAVRR